MSEHQLYTLYISPFEPDTIPFKELALYMADFADLLGQERNVRFDGVTDGCVQISAKVDREYAANVAANLTEATNDNSVNKQVRQVIDRLNQRLKNHGGYGYIVDSEGARAVDLPGNQVEIQASLKPFWQEEELLGQVYKVGGRDQTVPVTILDEEGNSIRCNTNRDTARQLAQHLFGAMLRIKGQARWTREPDHGWRMITFDISTFEVTEARTLDDDLRLLREVDAKWLSHPDPISLLETDNSEDFH